MVFRGYFFLVEYIIQCPHHRSLPPWISDHNQADRNPNLTLSPPPAFGGPSGGAKGLRGIRSWCGSLIHRGKLGGELVGLPRIQHPHSLSSIFSSSWSSFVAWLVFCIWCWTLISFLLFPMLVFQLAWVRVTSLLIEKAGGLLGQLWLCGQ